MNRTANNPSLAERLVDSPTESFSFRDIIAKIFLRPKLFMVAVLTPAVIAMTMSAMVPVEWSASTKILIRYSAAEAGFLKNIVSEGGLGLSGATSAELIKSAPVLERTIDKVGIKEEDVYKTSGRIIADKVFGTIHFILHPSDWFKKDNLEKKDPVQAAIDRTGLIDSFKASLDSSSKKTGKGQSIEILEKTSLVPESMKLDELITVEVKSFNREKVDDMANGLAEAFIDEYYHIYLQEAQRQSSYMDSLIAKEEEQLKRIEQATPADLVNGSAQTNGGGRELIARDVPILASLATELSIAEAALTKAQQVYAPNSAQVRRLSSQVANLKFMLKKQERIEISKQLIEQLKTKRFQAQNTEKVYKNKLVPINIIERANEPGKSSSKKIMRVVMSGIIGLVLGSILAVSLMVVLNVLDPRVHFKKEVEEQGDTPVIGQIPKIDALGLANAQAIRNNEKVNQGIWQLIAKIGEKSDGHIAKVISIASPMAGDGSTFCATALALNLAKNKQNRVCLVDANFVDAGLSKLFKADRKQGLIEAIVDDVEDYKTSLEDGRLTLIATGNLAKKTDLGYYTDAAHDFIRHIQSDFDFIIIDTGSALNNHESAIFGGVADERLLVVSSGVTRKNAVKAAEHKFASEGMKLSGIVFNRSQEILPKLIYNML